MSCPFARFSIVRPRAPRPAVAAFSPCAFEWVDVDMQSRWTSGFLLSRHSSGNFAVLVDTAGPQCLDQLLPVCRLAPFRSRCLKSNRLSVRMKAAMRHYGVRFRSEVKDRLHRRAYVASESCFVQLFAGFFPGLASAKPWSQFTAAEALFAFFEFAAQAADSSESDLLAKVWQTVWPCEKLTLSRVETDTDGGARAVIAEHLRALCNPICPVFMLKSFNTIAKHCGPTAPEGTKRFFLTLKSEDTLRDYSKALLKHIDYRVRLLDVVKALRGVTAALKLHEVRRVEGLGGRLRSVLSDLQPLLTNPTDAIAEYKAQIVAAMLTAPYPLGGVVLDDLLTYSLLDEATYRRFEICAPAPARVSLYYLFIPSKHQSAIPQLAVNRSERCKELFVEYAVSQSECGKELEKLSFLVRDFEVLRTYAGLECVRRAGRVRRLMFLWVRERNRAVGTVPKTVAARVVTQFM